jgi:LacI family transcriptional regulator
MNRNRQRNNRNRSSADRVARAPTRRELNAVTLWDIAKAAGVSAQTVSCVVNNSGSISEVVRERIRRFIDELGYMPNKSAKTMRTGRSQTLGLVIADIRHPFFPELAHAVQRAAREAGYALLLVTTDGSPEEVAERVATLKSHAVEGIVSTENIAPVQRLGLPTVIVGDPARGMDSITSDDVAGGTMLAEYLLAHGHRRFGLVTSPRRGCVPTRRAAFVKRIEGEADVVWEMYTPPSEILTEGIASTLGRRDVSAIVCSHDLIAIDVLRALRQHGLRVPDDVSVVGFDDIPWASIVTPALTTVRQPFSGLGQGAIDLLVDRIANPERRSRRITLGVNLIERETVTHRQLAKRTEKVLPRTKIAISSA